MRGLLWLGVRRRRTAAGRMPGVTWRTLWIKSVTFADNGAKIQVRGKTGDRSLRLTIPFLYWPPD